MTPCLKFGNFKDYILNTNVCSCCRHGKKKKINHNSKAETNVRALDRVSISNIAKNFWAQPVFIDKENFIKRALFVYVKNQWDVWSWNRIFEVGLYRISGLFWYPVSFTGYPAGRITRYPVKLLNYEWANFFSEPFH